MANHVSIPVKIVGNERWGQLCVLGDEHLICAERVRIKDEHFTFAGQHRVRLYSFKKNVNWKIPIGVSLDVAEVLPATPPRREIRR
jgi:hypothetical protein